jgi:acyl-CoA synthetase (NDP forming)
MNLIEQLDYLFNPRSIAVVGASNNPSKWGFDVFRSLLRNGGDRELYPINKAEEEVLGVKSYKSIEEVPHPIDLAVLIVPSSSVPQVMEHCVQKRVKAAVVITGGFAESDKDGAKLEREVVNIARRGGVRFLGPNTNGFFDTGSEIFLTFQFSSAKRGGISVIAQSGNVGMNIAQAGVEMGLGFNKWIGTGNEADLHFEDFLEYLGQDKDTKLIVGYIEGLREGRRFLSLAKEITKTKPIIALKIGGAATVSRAARSHTAALTGNKEIYDAAFKQTGVIRAEEITELLDTAAALIRQPLPRGRKVGIFTGGGGFGVVGTDTCEKLNLEVATLSPATFEKLDAVLPSRWSHINPVDTVGLAATDPLSFYPCLHTLMRDENIDAVISLTAIGQGMPLSRTELTPWAKAIEEEELNLIGQTIELMDQLHKPLLISLVLSDVRRESPIFKKLQENGIIVYPTPEQAVKALAHLVEYSEYLRGSQS